MNKRTAFTLIELLIVVAIIAILAAIAVPNFLEAQTRSKISRAKSDERSIATAIEAYVVDYNKLPRDGNDPGITVITFTQETGIPGDAVPGVGGDVYGYFLRRPTIWAAFTTPVAYITSIPTDAFSRVMPYGYETWWDDNNNMPYFCLITCLGPDRDMDSGYGGVNGIYDSTNGTKSNGDIVRLAGVRDVDMVKYFFGSTFDMSPH